MTMASRRTSSGRPHMPVSSNGTFSVAAIPIDGRTLVVLTRVTSERIARLRAQQEADDRGCAVSLICQTPTERVLVDQYSPASHY